MGPAGIPLADDGDPTMERIHAIVDRLTAELDAMIDQHDLLYVGQDWVVSTPNGDHQFADAVDAVAFADTLPRDQFIIGSPLVETLEGKTGRFLTDSAAWED